MKCDKCKTPLMFIGVKYPTIKYIHVDGVIGGIPTRINETFVFEFQCQNCLEFSNYTADGYEFANEFYKSIRTNPTISEPMENIIKQIRKIKGVVTVEPFGKNGAVVLFEPKPKKTAVKCENSKQIDFVLTTGGAVPDDGYFGEIVTFPKYISDHNLQGEWSAFSKPKSLSPDELVDGKIYVDEDGSFTTIFRHKSNGGVYSRCEPTGNWVNSISIYYEFIRSATPSEAQSLIRAEIANGFFFELK